MDKIFTFLSACLLALLCSRQVECHHTTNRLSIYYESICPDSKKFVLQQLIPAYEKLSDYLELELIPFGNANVSYPNHDFKPFFQCQHGPDECYGNRAHACVIDVFRSTKVSLQYIKCMFEADNWKQTQFTAQKCAERWGLNWETLRECIDGAQGERLLVAHSHKTFNLDPPKQYVPWIVIDDMHSDSMQKLAEKSLLKYICNTYHDTHEPKLPQCSEANIQSQLSAAFMTTISYATLVLSFALSALFIKL